VSVLGWIFLGLIAGILVGKFLVPRDPAVFTITVLTGILVALIGGFLGRATGLYREDNPVGFVMTLSAILSCLCFIAWFIANRSNRSGPTTQ
jgi:uncharacterized membrane protein YeaQ/YmgE (transglycosylase-associated protein family)